MRMLTRLSLIPAGLLLTLGLGSGAGNRPAGGTILGWASSPHERIRPDARPEWLVRRDLHALWKTGSGDAPWKVN